MKTLVSLILIFMTSVLGACAQTPPTPSPTETPTFPPYPDIDPDWPGDPYLRPSQFEPYLIEYAGQLYWLTPVPSPTPTSTGSPYPTQTPTDTPVPTNTPEPTATHCCPETDPTFAAWLTTPTDTPEPTNTPTNTPSPIATLDPADSIWHAGYICDLPIECATPPETGQILVATSTDGYLVENAGYSTANGCYEYEGLYLGINYYQNDTSGLYMFRDTIMKVKYWHITDMPPPWGAPHTVYYRLQDDSDTPPICSWTAISHEYEPDADVSFPPCGVDGWFPTDPMDPDDSVYNANKIRGKGIFSSDGTGSVIWPTNDGTPHPHFFGYDPNVGYFQLYTPVPTSAPTNTPTNTPTPTRTPTNTPTPTRTPTSSPTIAYLKLDCSNAPITGKLSHQPSSTANRSVLLLSPYSSRGTAASNHYISEYDATAGCYCGINTTGTEYLSWPIEDIYFYGSNMYIMKITVYYHKGHTASTITYYDIAYNNSVSAGMVTVMSSSTGWGSGLTGHRYDDLYDSTGVALSPAAGVVLTIGINNGGYTNNLKIKGIRIEYERR